MKWRSSLLYFSFVFLPYVILIAYVFQIYPQLPERFSSGVPRFVLPIIVAITGILPLTHGALVFGFRRYLKQIYCLAVTIFMSGALILLLYVVYQIG